MTVKAVLFDLDGTLVDTSTLEHLRKARKWKDCVAKCGSTSCFPAISEVLTRLREEDVKIGIVTTSVSFYAERLCGHHGIKYDTLVAWHDVRRQKPAPDPFLKVLERLNVSAREAVGVGDDAPDATALNAAGIPALGAGWSPVLQRGAGWSRILEAPEQLLTLLAKSK
jgi:HAD superfamily hydrolase (TIGR01549 family)